MILEMMSCETRGNLDVLPHDSKNAASQI